MKISDNDGIKWIEITEDEYKNNYSDKVNYRADAGIGIKYYKREVIIPLGKEWFIKLQERIGNH